MRGERFERAAWREDPIDVFLLPVPKKAIAGLGFSFLTCSTMSESLMVSKSTPRMMRQSFGFTIP
jgi:hypothetical protein